MSSEWSPCHERKVPAIRCASVFESLNRKSCGSGKPLWTHWQSLVKATPKRLMRTIDSDRRSRAGGLGRLAHQHASVLSDDRVLLPFSASQPPLNVTAQSLSARLHGDTIKSTASNLPSRGISCYISHSIRHVEPAQEGIQAATRTGTEAHVFKHEVEFVTSGLCSLPQCINRLQMGCAAHRAGN